MLEQVNLEKAISKEKYKPEAKALKARLSGLQQKVKEAKLPVLVLFEGWGAAGKGSLISDVILQLDPRGFKVYSTAAAEEFERRRPFLWRYWNLIPQYGEFSVLDRSWYQEITTARVEEKIGNEENSRRIQRINTFERQLTDDGYLLIKFFLHIDKEEQKERFEKLEKASVTTWRVTRRDWYHNEHYAEYYTAFDEMLERTNTPNAPWQMISAHDKYNASLEVFRTLVTQIETALAAREQKKSMPVMTGDAIDYGNFNLVTMPKLEDISLDCTIEKEPYDETLKKLQKKLKRLHNEIYLKKIPVIIAYEGWDAAGKGGNIKRVAAALDPRGYEVCPIAAPDKYELAHHYLWRFWKHIPKTGHVEIFDRTWYGRVMVERIEGFCTQEQWRRAYREINEFERELHEWGAVIVKFWIHVSKEEQLRRFNDRQNTPEKQWKITDEDWRNREKWDDYEQAVDEMIRYTSTDFAPWTIVESEDKKYARIKALEVLIDAIEKRLEQAEKEEKKSGDENFPQESQKGKKSGKKDKGKKK